MAMAWPRLSLRARLFILTALALLPALAILLYNEVSLRHSREAEVHALALRFGQLAALEMQGVLEGAEGLLLAITQVPAVCSFDAEPCSTYLASVQAQSPHLIGITVIARDGLIRCRTDGSGQGQRLDDRPYFRPCWQRDGSWSASIRSAEFPGSQGCRLRSRSGMRRVRSSGLSWPV
ncbi:hypothetical protein [Microvirga sesbaniae]|uniref:hypothetical protein n=1 Tax=Microvirga sesbaniae TaxID=681392 RepID=UPI0021C5C55A|nr:hypothetical protein [Microvirga sp. HBU67692]